MYLSALIFELQEYYDHHGNVPVLEGNGQPLYSIKFDKNEKCVVIGNNPND